MKSHVKSVYIGTPILGFYKHNINDTNGNPILTVHPKIGIKPKFYFYKDNQLVFYGVLRMSKSIVITKFVIYNEHNEEVAIVSEKPIYQKSQIFKEFNILVGVKEYDVQYTIASRSFSIKDSHGELCVEGKRITSIFKNMINLRKYKVDIYDNQLDLNLWLVIIKGMQVLE